MASYTVSTTGQTVATTGRWSFTNSGSVNVYLTWTEASSQPRNEILAPGATADYRVNGNVTAVTRSSTAALTATSLVEPTWVSVDAAAYAADPAFTGTYARLEGRRRVGFLGDSITAGADTYTSNLTGTQENNDTPSTYAVLAGAGKWDLVINAGVPGERSDQILARVQSDIIANKCDVCVIYSWAFNGLGQGLTVAQDIANLEQIVVRLLAGGVMPVICTPTPDSRTGSSAGRQTGLGQRRRLAINLAQRYGVAVVDLYPLLVDPLTNTLATGYWTSDIHPNTAGRAVGGQAVASVLGALYPGTGTIAFGGPGDTDDLLAGNGFFVTDSNADGLANNWTRSGDAGPTTSLVTDSVLGRMQRITCAASASNVQFVMATFPTVVPLSTLEISAYVSKVGTAGAQFQISGTGLSKKFTVIGASPDVTRGYVSFRCVVPAGTVNIAATLLVTGGTGTVDYGRFGVRDITALGAS